MTSAAEAALARAADAERGAAAEVVSLRKGRRARREVEAARVEEERRRERRDVDALVADVDAAEKEVLRKAERNAETMETLRASVDALAARLAGEGGGGFAIVEKTGKSRTIFVPRGGDVRESRDGGGRGRVSNSGSAFRPLALSAGTTSRRHAPVVSEVATRGNGVSGFEPATAGVRPDTLIRRRRGGDGGARGGGSARARRDEREREAAVRGTGFVSATEDAASTFASRREARPPRNDFEEGEKEKARAEARRARVARDGARGGALATRGLAGSTGGARGE